MWLLHRVSGTIQSDARLDAATRLSQRINADEHIYRLLIDGAGHSAVLVLPQHSSE
jgi:hypothetical protein